jgi:hypothetical protein
VQNVLGGIEEAAAISPVLFRILQTNRLIRYVHTEREKVISFKELIHVTMEVGNSKIYRVGYEARHPQRNECYNSSLKNSLLLKEVTLSSTQAFNDWLRFRHIPEDNRLCSSSLI